MRSEGTILDGSKSRWEAWEPEHELRSFSLGDVRYSRGFLRADMTSWFERLPGDWVAFFRSVGSDVQLASVETGLEFPEGLDRIVAVEFDNEPGVIGMSSATEQLLSDVVCRDVDRRAAELVVEYLERRFLSTLVRCWSGMLPISCLYAANSGSEEVEVSGVVHLSLLIGGAPCDVWAGVGPKMLDRLDETWRDLLRTKAQQEHQEPGSGEHLVSVQLAEISVRPEMLVDYLRTGTLIGLTLPVSSDVLLRLDGAPWAFGSLGQFSGGQSGNRFAVEIVQLTSEEPSPKDSATHLQVEIARVSLDGNEVLYHSQPGAVLLTKTLVGASAPLLISGEQVASAVLGQIEGQFALNVLPK